MNRAALDSLPEGLSIIYDGDCPFCAAYARLYVVRAHVGEIALINAREQPALVSELRAKGMDINDGMVVSWLGKRYWGADAMHILSVLGAASGVFGAANRFLFRRKRMARLSYPVLAAARRLSLGVLGRKLIA